MAIGLKSVNLNENIYKILFSILICVNILMIGLISMVYFYFMNLIIPTTKIPWSQNRNHNFIIETSYRCILSFLYVYSDVYIFIFAGSIICILIMLYHLHSLIVLTYMNNKFILYFKVFIDILMINLLLLLVLGIIRTPV
jgi:hypothetical protein